MKDFSFGIIPYRVADQGGFEILLLRHAAGGHWGFPKGHAEDGESKLETALRELREETGLTEVNIVPDHNLVQRYSFSKNGIQYEKTVEYFLGQVAVSDEVVCQTSEISEWLWVGTETESPVELYDETQALFEQAVSILGELHYRSMR